MHIPGIVGVMALHLLTFAASTPLPDVHDNVPPPLSTASSSSDPSSSDTWTPPSVYVGNSIQTNDQDISQARPLSGPHILQSDLFGSVDSSQGSSRSTMSTSDANEQQREEQQTERQPPPGGWKDKRQLHNVADSGNDSTAINRPILSGEDADGP